MKLMNMVVFLGICALHGAIAQAGTMTLGAPIPLSFLQANNGTVVAGDKIFSDFDYAPTEDMPSSAAVNVIPIVDGDGNYGVRFQGGFVDLPGGDPSDALITFSVNVAPSAGMLINDVHLAANVDLLGGTGLAAVTETFLPDFAMMSLSVYDDGTNSQLTDWSDLPETVGPGRPIETLHVQKDIVLRADSAVAATLSFVDQTFSQVLVPEPGAASLTLFGSLAACLVLRRHRCG